MKKCGFMNNLEIKFIPASQQVENFVQYPKPTKMYVPDWYKKGENVAPSKFKYSGNGSIDNPVLKMCAPFFDAMSHGYVQESWCDIYIEKKQNEIKYYYSHEPKIIDARPEINIPKNNIFYNAEFTWFIPWMPKLPKGYSALFITPMNRPDLPFENSAGIIDSDQYFHSSFGKIPFYIKNNFEGIIPCGTPIYQIIPIKRESWKSSIEKYDEKNNSIMSYKSRKHFWGNYKKNFWTKKYFN